MPIQDQLTFLQCSEDSLKKFDLQVRDKRELLNLINETFYRKTAKTTKEKFETLLLRDKILKLLRYELYQHQSVNEQTQHLFGSCPDMCPEKERYSRDCLSLCHSYEMDPETNQPDHYLMIKEYSRSSADQDLPLPNEMRPLSVLYDTMLYLIENVISKIETYSGSDPNENEADFSLGEWYDFIWNRTRSIRKDIIQQRLLLNYQNLVNPVPEAQSDNSNIRSGLGGVLIIEQCARFHIMCAHRLCDQESNIFDFKINEENLKNCFQSLRQYYEMSRESASMEPSPNEAEFRSYSILLNLNESNILCEIQRWPEDIRHSVSVRFALSIYFAYNSRNYIKFFRLVKSNQCEYLNASILHRYFYKIRCEAFKTIMTSYRDKEKTFPVSKLVDWLGFDDTEQLFEYCNSYGLDISEDFSQVKMKSALESFNLSKTDEDRLKLKRSCLLVENKFYYRLKSCEPELSHEDCLSEIISGLNITEVKQSRFLDPNYELQTSFDDEGHFNPIEIENLIAEAKSKSPPSNAPVPKLIKPKLEKSNKLILKTAMQIKNKALGRQSSFGLNESGLKRERKKSASSNSSASSETTKQIETPEESAAKKPMFKGFGQTEPKNLFSSITAPKPPAENLFANLINPSKPPSEVSLFTSRPINSAPSFESSIFRANKPPEGSLFGSRPSGNLFESILKKQEEVPPPAVQPPKPLVDNLKEKFLDQSSEFVFESILREILRNFLLETVQDEICSNLIDQFVQQKVREIVQAELEESIQFRAKNRLSDQIFDSLLDSITRNTCLEFLNNQAELEALIYDDILCNVFQKEFEIILKQIANEINNDLILDRLAENVYFDDSYDEMPSIFTTDLMSFMHNSIYEFTRLNLNVNRELYYEIKQALDLSQQLFLFRKWRLKLSIKLLNREHRRASLSLKQSDQHNLSLNQQQLHSISFMATYGNYLLVNLSKLEKLRFFLTPRSIRLVHCEKFQEHLCKHLSLNFKYYLYEFLSENYFNIIHNRDSEIVLQIPYTEPSEQQISVKTILCSEENWILERFFGRQREKNFFFENLSINLLEPNEFSIKFCVKLFNQALDSRDFYGSNSIIFILESINPQIGFRNYIQKNKEDFYKILRNLNENFDLKQYEFMFISYLDQELTLNCIQSILGEGQKNFVYCLVENNPPSVRDIFLMEQIYEEFLFKLFRRYSNPPRLNTSVNLSDLIYLTLIKFLDFLIQNSVKSFWFLSLDFCIKEFNSRLDKLVYLLTREEYFKINWPMPELVDELDPSKWTLKYWNSKECFSLLQANLRSLISLPEANEAKQEEDYWLEFDLIETKLFDYLNKVLKIIKPSLEKETFQCNLLSSIQISLENLKKLAIIKQNKLYIAKENLNWAVFLKPIVEYLISNSSLRFLDKLIGLDQFYMFVDANLIKSTDWIQKEDLSRKYKIEIASANLKRRFSVDNLLVNKEIRQVKEKAEIKPKRLMTSQAVVTVSKELDLNFEKFLSVLSKEKENNIKFENRLADLANDSSQVENSEISTDQENKKEESNSLDNLLKKLQEEKLKNSQFTDRLNKMLWN